MTAKAAMHIMDLAKFLSCQQGTLDQIRLMMGKHPFFGKLDAILSKGMDYRFAKTIPESRFDETSAMMQRGNHKLVQAGREMRRTCC